MAQKSAEETIKVYVYDFKSGKTRCFHLEIMAAVQTARMQAFVAASRMGFVLKFYNFNNLKLCRNLGTLVGAVNQTGFKRDASRKRYNYRLSSQEVVFQKSIEFLQTINVYKYFQNNTAYLGDITVQFIGSNYMDRFSRFTTDSLVHRSCLAGSPCKYRQTPSTMMKGIYGQGFYNNIQPDPYGDADDDDDDVHHGNDMFLLFSSHHRVLEAARCQSDVEGVATSYADILTRFGDPQYVKVVMQNSLRLRFFTLNIRFKIFYYIREIFPDLELNQRFQVMHCLNSANNVFDQIQILGYNLLLYDNSCVDYYTFKEFQQFSDEFEKISDDQFRLTSEMRVAMAMEFLDSDFIEVVVKACDITADASNRKRMKYTDNLKS